RFAGEAARGPKLIARPARAGEIVLHCSATSPCPGLLSMGRIFSVAGNVRGIGEAMTGELPGRMVAIAIPQPGGPEALVAESRPVPRPGAGEVLIATSFAGVNRPDVLQR